MNAVGFVQLQKCIVFERERTPLPKRRLHLKPVGLFDQGKVLWSNHSSNDTAAGFDQGSDNGITCRSRKFECGALWQEPFAIIFQEALMGVT
jgi:hypothetical protein